MSTLNLAATTLVTLALLLTALSLHVSRLRLRYRQTWGDGGHKDLAAAIRTHGNTLEQSMLFGLLLLAHAQLHSSTPGALAVACAGFVLARLLYCMGALTRRLAWRQAAHAFTLLTQLTATALLAHTAWTA
ncbi:MAPEG family protein [Acidovorax sp. ACV01]|uniref:MAPEG family protein n=1 Tax=Acidovorax sp. ACV01 TaxID=2769311 RepID=UPI001CE145E2|nr:MAPEG family protein [Acidovorax sp. ACV01]